MTNPDEIADDLVVDMGTADVWVVTSTITLWGSDQARWSTAGLILARLPHVSLARGDVPHGLLGVVDLRPACMSAWAPRGGGSSRAGIVSGES